LKQRKNVVSLEKYESFFIEIRKEDLKMKESIYKNYDEFKSKNKGIYYYFTRYGHKPHTSFDYSNKSVNIYFFFGKESTGIPPKILKPYLDNCMRMPMTDKVRSLNLSNTVAIMIYECLRQQNYNDLLKDEPHKSINFIEEFED
jgi:tRNA (cytidine/uridine-2'-O-)-methyltransferase